MSAPLSRTDVERIAELARLELTPTKSTLFTRQLADILEYVEQIRGLDTTGVEPTSHAINRPVRSTDDVPVRSLDRQEALANAPDAALETGLFKVPRVIG